MLLMSCITTFWLLDKLIENIRKNPIVIYQSDIATQITNIAFPTITYCTAPTQKCWKNVMQSCICLVEIGASFPMKSEF